jgi:GntR family transcriptional regulator, rspAB operon transcriptional repressor
VPAPQRALQPSSSLPGALTGRGRTNTASNLIYRALRDEIVSMRRKPGSPVSEKEIALAHRVSRTPVREALLRLADEQLVEIFPQSGTFVARIPVGALPEAILVRKALEETTARLAAERASRDQVAALHKTIERQKRTQAKADRERFHEADEAFHAAIADAAGHRGIWNLVREVKMQVDRYRRLTLPLPGRMSRVLVEHGSIVAAIEGHDPERAAASMIKHLDGLAASIGDIRDLNPEYFADGC